MSEETIPGPETPAETPISEKPDDVGPDGLEVLTEHEDPEPEETAVRVDPPSNLQEFLPTVGSPVSYADLPDCRNAKIGDWAYETRFVQLPKATIKAHLVIDGEMRVFERVGQSDAWERKA